MFKTRRKYQLGDLDEKKLQKQVVEFLRKANIFFYHPRETKKGTDGIPDLICCIKGLFLAIELKSPQYKNPASKLRKEQIKVKEKIESSGGIYIVSNDFEEIVEKVNLIIKKADKLCQQSHQDKENCLV